MKKIYTCLTLLILAIAAIGTTSCNNSGELKIESVPFQSKEDGDWGLVNSKGKELEGAEFKNVPTVVTEGRYWVKNNKGYWELYSTDKNQPIVDNEYRYVTIFRKGKALVAKRDENVTVIDKKGEVVADFSKIGSYKPDQFSGFNGELAVFSVNEKVGVCDIKGEVVLKPIYSMIAEPQCGKIVATDSIAFNSMVALDSVSEGPKGNVVVFDYTGNELIKLPRKKYSMTGERFYDDYIAVAKERKDEDAEEGMMNWGIVNVKGEEVVKPSKKYSYISEIKEDMFIYYDGEHWGVQKFDGTKVLPAKYFSITFQEDYIVAQKSNTDAEEYDFEEMEAQLFDLKGESVLKKKYHDLRVMGKCIFAQAEQDKWDVLDLKGEKIEDAPRIYSIRFDEVGDFYVSTDKIDISAFVKNLDFTSGSMDGLTFSSSVQQALKRQSEYYSFNNTPKAADYNYTDEVNIYRRVDGCGVSETIKYPQKLSHQTYRDERVIDFWIGWTYYYHINKIPTGYTFTASKPQWFSMTFDNYGILRGKLKTLYKALCERFKEMGSEEDHSSSATCFKLNDGRYAIVYLEPHNVTAKWGSLSSSERSVYQYTEKEDLTVEDEAVEFEGD